MISISTNKIILTRGGGYNLTSLRNLRQNRKNEEIGRFGTVDQCIESKYRTILVNWFEVKNACTASIRSKIYFQTLTFPTNTGEHEAKEMLKKYLAYLRASGCSHYFWTLEKSGVLGDNVHFHLLVDLETLDGLKEKWAKITKSQSKFGWHTTKINDWKGIINYILKGHEHQRETRQFGMSRSLTDFKPIKMEGVEASAYLLENQNGLRLFKAEQFYTVLLPTEKQKKKIISLFLVKYCNRKSEIYERITRGSRKDHERITRGSKEI